MKLPNFRLYDTQATTSLVTGVAGVIFCVMMALVVFHNLDKKAMVVVYNDRAGIGQYRQALVYLFGAVCMLIGVLSGVMGFNSMGQKRNNRQSHSWLGMTLGAICLAAAPVLIFAWKTMSEPLIQKSLNG